MKVKGEMYNSNFLNLYHYIKDAVNKRRVLLVKKMFIPLFNTFVEAVCSKLFVWGDLRTYLWYQLD